MMQTNLGRLEVLEKMEVEEMAKASTEAGVPHPFEATTFRSPFEAERRGVCWLSGFIDCFCLESC